MNRKRKLSLWLVLLMLAMTACGKPQNTTQETTQESKANVQIVEPIIPESTVSGSSQADGTASEDQDQSDAQVNPRLKVKGQKTEVRDI